MPEKIEIFHKFARKNRNVFTRIHDPQRFQTRLTPLNVLETGLHRKYCF